MGEHAFQNQEESLAQTIFPAKFQESKRLRTYEPFPARQAQKGQTKPLARVYTQINGACHKARFPRPSHQSGKPLFQRRAFHLSEDFRYGPFLATFQINRFRGNLVPKPCDLTFGVMP